MQMNSYDAYRDFNRLSYTTMRVHQELASLRRSAHRALHFPSRLYICIIYLINERIFYPFIIIHPSVSNNQIINTNIRKKNTLSNQVDRVPKHRKPTFSKMYLRSRWRRRMRSATSRLPDIQRHVPKSLLVSNFIKITTVQSVENWLKNSFRQWFIILTFELLPVTKIRAGAIWSKRQPIKGYKDDNCAIIPVYKYINM